MQLMLIGLMKSWGIISLTATTGQGTRIKLQIVLHSCQSTDTPWIKGNGHDWTVDPSWEANVGLAYEIWATQLDSKQTTLQECFANVCGTSIGHAITCWDIKSMTVICIKLVMESPLVHMSWMCTRRRLLSCQGSNMRKEVILDEIWSKSCSLAISAAPSRTNPSWP